MVFACGLAPVAQAEDLDAPDATIGALRVPRQPRPAGLVAQLKDAPAEGRSRADALLSDDGLDEVEVPQTKFFGFDQAETAYTYSRPAHWSKLTNRLELGAQGVFDPALRWKLSGRFDYNAIYDLSSFYPSTVRDDARFNFQFRETYLDAEAGDVDFRFGRQQIVWGEVVGLFVADVVSAKDTRESILPDFDLIRIPQWAARAEYFRNDIHVEAVWIPLPTIDKIGRPGSDYFPYPPAPPAGYAYVVNNEVKPNNAARQNYGLRVSILRGGWDVAAFAYRSLDASPTFFRQVVQAPVPAVVYTPRHDQITQYGMTLAKDFTDLLLKAEAVYTVGRNYNVTTLADGDGVVSQNTLDYILGVDVPMPGDQRFNAQFFQRIFRHHDPTILPRRVESGATLFWSDKWGRWEPQVLLIHSLNHGDYLYRPKVVWNFRKEWRAVFGVDIFGGKDTGLFGQYDQKDRVYAEVRRSF